MLFIANPRKGTKKDVLWLHILPTAIVFIAFMTVTIWSWQTTRSRVAAQRDQAIADQIGQIESRIHDRMDAYQQILISANGLFAASDHVSRDEWRTFYDNYNVPKNYPGLQGVAFAERVPADQLEAHLNQVRSEGFADYRITPEGARSLYVPIVYPVSTITPETYKDVTGFGYDISTDPVRSQALATANRTKSAALSGRLTLMQADAKNEPAFIFYQPIHTKGDATAITGYAVAPFNARSFFEGIFGSGGSNARLGFRVYDLYPSNNTYLYENELFGKIDGAPIQKTITVAGRDWVVQYKAPDNLLSDSNRRNPTATLIGGLIFSVLVAGLVLSLLMSRTRSLAYAENRELQQAKDDLLSIASHQLRTPATGVKQYIGMLREGFAGKVTRKQQRLLDEAYQSNERQLAIIDEILHVARIDTGRLELQKERLKIRDITDKILREQAQAIKQKSQRILTRFPKRILYGYGDPQYLRMALENIISNAIKYTPDKGTIIIAIRRVGDFAAIEVTDTGVGIAKKDMELLFQKFSRIPNELSRQTAGSGVGLYVAKQIVDMHDGSIEVESDAGKGTTFRILLPLALRGEQKRDSRNV